MMLASTLHGLEGRQQSWQAIEAAVQRTPHSCLWHFSCVCDAAGKEVGRARGQAAAVAGHRVGCTARERKRGSRGGRQRQRRRRVQVVTVGSSLQPQPWACRQLDLRLFLGWRAT